MFHKILVYENAFADEHPALQRALQLARYGEVELKIVDVVEAAANAPHDRHRKMRSLVEQERKDRLDVDLRSIARSGHQLHDGVAPRATVRRDCPGSCPRGLPPGDQNGVFGNAQRGDRRDGSGRHAAGAKLPMSDLARSPRSRSAQSADSRRNRSPGGGR